MKKAIAVLALVLMCGVCFADDTVQPVRRNPTANVSAIKEVTEARPSVTSTAPKVYEIPMTQIMEKADGSGTVEVKSQAVKVTKEQLEEGIKRAKDMIAMQQAQVEKIQEQLDKINELEAKPIG